MTGALVARLIGFSFLTGVRPFLTMALAQSVALLAVAFHWVAVDSDYAALLAGPVVAVVFGLALVEALVTYDADLDELRRAVQFDKVSSVVAATYCTLLLFALGEPAPDMLPIDAPFAPAIAATLGHSDHMPALWVQAAAIGGAGAFSLVLSWLRGIVTDWIAHAGLHGGWAVLETGGVPLALLLLVLAPVVLLVLTLVLTFLVAVAAAGGRVWQRRADRRARVPCEACGAHVRGEASVCWRCQAALTPTRRLGEAPLTSGVPS